MSDAISPQELNERIAIVRRFRALLEQQRAKFQEYLTILDKQETKISEADAESALIHADLENQIVKNIRSLQKVIIPMRTLYEKSRATAYNPAEVVPVEKLQRDLEVLRHEVIQRNERNQKLLKAQMEKLRTQIASSRNPYRSSQSIYAKQENLGTRVHLDA